MFSRQVPATIASLLLHEIRLRKQVSAAFTIAIKFDFTESMAEDIGGDAPMIQKSLANGTDRPCKVKSPKLQMDTRHVRAKLNAGKDDKVTVGHTVDLTATASRPSSSGGTMPSLSLRLVFRVDADDEETAGDADRFMAFCRRHRGKVIKVRLDRQQQQLPLGEEPEPEEAGEPEVEKDPEETPEQTEIGELPA